VSHAIKYSPREGTIGINSLDTDLRHSATHRERDHHSCGPGGKNVELGVLVRGPNVALVDRILDLCEDR